MGDITNAIEERKPAGNLFLNYLENIRDRSNMSIKNVCLVERNNHLIECFTEGCLNLEL